VPWDPSSAIIAPLGIIALFAGRKKKGSKFGTFVVLLLVLGSVGMTLAAGQSLPARPIYQHQKRVYAYCAIIKET